MVRLILLDRDGVINFDSPDYIKTADEWRPIPGSLDAIAALRAEGFKVAVCTNQAGIARGKLGESDLAAIHDKMGAALDTLDTRLDGLVFCPHHPDDNCQCRKPQPGMLLEMMQRLSTNARNTIFVGDSVQDAQAAHAAGCRAALVRTGNGRRAEVAARTLGLAVEVFDDLADFASEFASERPS